MSENQLNDSNMYADIARQRDEVVKRMLATPPQPRPKSEKKPKA